MTRTDQEKPNTSENIGSVSVDGRACDIVQTIHVSNLTIVRLEVPSRTVCNRNVKAYDERNELVWTIAESPHGTQADKPYMSIRIDPQGRLIAGNWIGIDYIVDLKTGAITPHVLTK